MIKYINIFKKGRQHYIEVIESCFTSKQWRRLKKARKAARKARRINRLTLQHKRH